MRALLVALALVAGCKRPRPTTWDGAPGPLTCGASRNYVSTCVGYGRTWACVVDSSNAAHCAPIVPTAPEGP